MTLPLLSGEVFPLVDLVPVTTRRIESAKMSNLSVTWGQSPGTAITPFNTASLVSELATVVWPVAAPRLELDNNMMADSPVNVGAEVTELYSERLKSELDRVVVSGNGYNEPLGILNTSGLVTVTSDNSDRPDRRPFPITKVYCSRWRSSTATVAGHPPSSATIRVTEEPRGIQVGAGDERRVFGMDHESYQLLDYKYAIQNDIPNNKLLDAGSAARRGCPASRFRSRRDPRRPATGAANTTLVVIRSRFGGQAIDPNAFALISDAQS